MHHTKIDGRKINVELTAGGGGKSEARMAKIQDKNAQVAQQRAEGRKSGQGKPKKDADDKLSPKE